MSEDVKHFGDVYSTAGDDPLVVMVIVPGDRSSHITVTLDPGSSGSWERNETDRFHLSTEHSMWKKVSR